MKKTNKPLTLSRETVRTLRAELLPHAHGAMQDQSTACLTTTCPTTACSGSGCTYCRSCGDCGLMKP
jgi:hypothetical protein